MCICVNGERIKALLLRPRSYCDCNVLIENLEKTVLCSSIAAAAVELLLSLSLLYKPQQKTVHNFARLLRPTKLAASIAAPIKKCRNRSAFTPSLNEVPYTNLGFFSSLFSQSSLNHISLNVLVAQKDDFLLCVTSFMNVPLSYTCLVRNSVIVAAIEKKRFFFLDKIKK